MICSTVIIALFDLGLMQGTPVDGHIACQHIALLALIPN